MTGQWKLHHGDVHRLHRLERRCCSRRRHRRCRCGAGARRLHVQRCTQQHTRRRFSDGRTRAKQRGVRGRGLKPPRAHPQHQTARAQMRRSHLDRAAHETTSKRWKTAQRRQGASREAGGVEAPPGNSRVRQGEQNCRAWRGWAQRRGRTGQRLPHAPHATVAHSKGHETRCGVGAARRGPRRGHNDGGSRVRAASRPQRAVGGGSGVDARCHV